jgi:hypothetical protein
MRRTSALICRHGICRRTMFLGRGIEPRESGLGSEGQGLETELNSKRRAKSPWKRGVSWRWNVAGNGSFCSPLQGLAFFGCDIPRATLADSLALGWIGAAPLALRMGRGGSGASWSRGPKRWRATAVQDAGAFAEREASVGSARGRVITILSPLRGDPDRVGVWAYRGCRCAVLRSTPG